MFKHTGALRARALPLPGRHWSRGTSLIPLRWTLRRRLVFLVALALLPMLVCAYWLFDESVSQAKAATLGSSLVTAQATEADISGSVAATKRLLATLAEQPSVKAMDGTLMAYLFREALSSSPELLNLFAADSNGRVFTAASWDSDERRDISDRDYFKDAVLSGWPVVSSNRLISRSSGYPTAVVSVPIKNQLGDVVGVVVGEFSLQYLQGRLARLSSPQRGLVLLVDGEGVVLSHPDWDQVAAGLNMHYSPAVQAALRGEQGTLEFDDQRTKERYLVAYVPVTGTSWALNVIHPVDRVYAAVWETTLRGLLVLIVGLFVSTVGALALMHWISKPLDTLHSKVRSLMGNGQSSRPGGGTNDDLAQMVSAFDSLATMLDSRAAQLAELKRDVDRRNLQLKRLSVSMVQAEDTQRKRIAIDMHDGLAQLLALATFEAQEAGRYLQSDLTRAEEKIHSTLQLVQQASIEVRRDLFELHPPSLKRGGLVPWLKEYVERYALISGLRCEVDIGGTPVTLDPSVEMVVYRVVRECLHNIRKHAKATRVWCQLIFESGVVRLSLKDDGQGFSKEGFFADVPGHLGLMALEELVQVAGGEFKLESEPGRGTNVDLVIPRDQGKQRARSRGQRASAQPVVTKID